MCKCFLSEGDFPGCCVISISLVFAISALCYAVPGDAESTGETRRARIIERLVAGVPSARASGVVSFQTDTHTGLRVEGGAVTKKEVAVADTDLLKQGASHVLRIKGRFSVIKMAYGDVGVLPPLDHVAVDVTVEPRWLGDATYRRLRDLLPSHWSDVGPRNLVLMSAPAVPSSPAAGEDSGRAVRVYPQPQRQRASPIRALLGRLKEMKWTR